MEIAKIGKIDMRKFNGGARLGGGMRLGQKTKKTVAREAAQMYLIRCIEEEIEPLTKALIDKAKSQDVAALKEVFDRAWGKSKEKHAVTVGLSVPNEEIGAERLQAIADRLNHLEKYDS